MRSHVTRRVTSKLLILAIVPSLMAQSSADDQAKARYDYARRTLMTGNYTEALRDLDEAASKYTTSPWAGEALRLKVEYMLEVARNFSQAKADAERLKNFPAVEPAAYILAGRIKLAEDRSRASIESAIADFHRAHDYYPERTFVAEGRYREGDAKRLNGQVEDAIEEFQNLALSDPKSIWTARALLQLASCLTYRNRWPEAFSALQRLRLDFEGDAEAQPELQSAINLSTILYRLYIRKPPEQTPFKYSTAKPLAPSAKFEDVSAVTLLPADTVVVANKTGLVMVDADGEVLPGVRSQEPSAVAWRRPTESYLVTFKRDSAPVFLAQRMLQAGTAPGAMLRIPEPPDKTKFVDRGSALLHSWKREWLVADAGAKTIWAFNDTGEFSRTFLPSTANVSPDRLAVNTRDEIAVLDMDRKTVTLLDRDGRSFRTIEAAGPGHKFDRPVDIAFDSLGHLYVLDRGRANIVVFSPQLAPLPRVQTVFTGPAERDPGAFRRAVAFGIDSRGRLFIFDDNAKRIQVYQ